MGHSDWKLVIAAIAAVAGWQPAHALQQDSAIAPQAETCELHIWPTPDYLSDITGLFDPGYGPARRETAGIRDVMEPGGNSAMEHYLSPNAIAAAIGSMDLSTFMGRPVAVTFHFTDRREANRAARGRTRSTSSTAACYYELHVRRLMFQKSLVYGYRLYPFWRLKDFAGGRVNTESANNNVAMRGFPIDGTREEIHEALTTAFLEGLERFFTSYFRNRR